MRILVLVSLLAAAEGLLPTTVRAETRVAAALTPEAVWDAFNAAIGGSRDDEAMVRLLASGICHSDTAATPQARYRHEARIQAHLFIFYLLHPNLSGPRPHNCCWFDSCVSLYCDAIFKVLESPALSRYFFGDAAPA